MWSPSPVTNRLSVDLINCSDPLIVSDLAQNSRTISNKCPVTILTVDNNAEVKTNERKERKKDVTKI